MFLSQHSKLSQSHAISFPMTVRTASGVLSFLLRKCVRFAAYERDKQTVVELNCSLPCTTCIKEAERTKHVLPVEGQSL